MFYLLAYVVLHYQDTLNCCKVINFVALDLRASMCHASAVTQRGINHSSPAPQTSFSSSSLISLVGIAESNHLRIRRNNNYLQISSSMFSVEGEKLESVAKAR